MNAKREMAELVLTLLFVIGLHCARQLTMNLPVPVQDKPLAGKLIPGNNKQTDANNFEPASEIYAAVISSNPLNYSNDSFSGWRNNTPHINYSKLKGLKKYNFFSMRFANTFRHIKTMRYSPVFSMQERSKAVKSFPQPHRFGLTETRTDRTLLFIAD